jgi:hypothetical protein
MWALSPGPDVPRLDRFDCIKFFILIQVFLVYETYLKPHVFHTGIMYGLVAVVFIGMLIVLISINLF